MGAAEIMNGALVAQSEAMKYALAQITRSDRDVLVLQGTDHLEDLARYYLTQNSRSAPVVVTNGDVWGALPQAKGGGIFVPSLGAVGAAGQAQILRMLRVQADGRARGAPVRWPPLILGVERPLNGEAWHGRIQKELLPYLENVVRVPTLAERKEDLPELVLRLANAMAAELGALGVRFEDAQSFIDHEWKRLDELAGEVWRCGWVDDDGYLVVASPAVESSPVELEAPSPELEAPAVEASPAELELEAEALARRFHETYERLAPKFGYQTRPESSVEWDLVPAANKALMIAVASELLAAQNVCEHCLEAAPAARRFCSEACVRCEHESESENGCDNYCQKEAEPQEIGLKLQGPVQRFEEYEAQIFKLVLDHTGGCVSHAAKLLGVGRATMYRKIREHEINIPPRAERPRADRPKRA